jgi:CubicO group peptidase (beta-lactamase class C family)
MAHNFSPPRVFRNVCVAALGLACAALVWAGAAGSSPQRPPASRPVPRTSAAPSELRYDFSAADAAIEKAIADDEIPGAVLLVGYRGNVIYRRAYGSRAVLPEREPMTVNTIFDVASLTKVFATTPSS